MKKTFLLKNLPLLLIASGLLLTVAFAQTTSSKQVTRITDTVPSSHKKIRDLDEALGEIDHGEAEMYRALKEIDRDKLENEVRQAMKNVDMSKMKEEIASAMKDIDMDKINMEVKKAMQEVDCDKLKKEIDASLASIDMTKMKAELEKVKEIDFGKMQKELVNIQPEIDKAMKEAKVDIEKARKEITAYKNLVNALDKDGLLNKTENYKIEYKNNELTVNGKKLSAEATKKYSEYIGDKKEFTLQKNEDGLDIDNDK